MTQNKPQAKNLKKWHPFTAKPTRLSPALRPHEARYPGPKRWWSWSLHWITQPERLIWSCLNQMVNSIWNKHRQQQQQQRFLLSKNYPPLLDKRNKKWLHSPTEIPTGNLQRPQLHRWKQVPTCHRFDPQNAPSSERKNHGGLLLA